MRPRRSTSQTMRHANELRKEPSLAEARLWSRLRNHRLHRVGFRRQHAIGPYIADFCAPGRKLVIEVDGSQHLDQLEYDAQRTAYLAEQGYRVLRFWNHEVLKKYRRRPARHRAGVGGNLMKSFGFSSCIFLGLFYNINRTFGLRCKRFNAQTRVRR